MEKAERPESTAQIQFSMSVTSAEKSIRAIATRLTAGSAGKICGASDALKARVKGLAAELDSLVRRFATCKNRLLRFLPNWIFDMADAAFKIEIRSQAKIV